MGDPDEYLGVTNLGSRSNRPMADTSGKADLRSTLCDTKESLLRVVIGPSHPTTSDPDRHSARRPPAKSKPFAC